MPLFKPVDLFWIGQREFPALARVAAFFLIWLGVWLPVAFPLARILCWRLTQPIEMRQKLPLVVSLYLVFPFLFWDFIQVEGVSVADYGLVWRFSLLSSLALGLSLGLLGLVILIVIEYCLGWFDWPTSVQLDYPAVVGVEPQQSLPLRSVFLPTLLLGLFVSAIEELVFRGFLINQLQQDYAAWLAAAIASLVFAILHLAWEGRENIPQLPGLWLMGLVLVLARWADGGSLGLACGLHAGWIWGIASLDATQILVSTGKGPIWMTGSEGKPLEGLMAILLLLCTAIAVWGIGQLRGGS
ncbi:MAG: CPBP family intramembrane metalloprotease [Cyanothece sp. SIO1E1]|nr:CPBP family intramembrane metalloprotease [Cyanothece sp. SIO1E1]